MGVKLQAPLGGSVELVPTNSTSNYTVTTPAKTGTMAMDGPAFSYYQSVAQTGIAANTWTKATFTTSEFDTTSGMFASSRFTPTIAGYYQISAVVTNSGVGTNVGVVTGVYKNGGLFKEGTVSNGWAGAYATSSSATLVYLNGSTDYIEIYCYGQSAGGVWSTVNTRENTFFQAVLVRGA